MISERMERNLQWMPAETGTYIWMATYRNTDTKAMQFRKGFVIVLH